MCWLDVGAAGTGVGFGGKTDAFSNNNYEIIFLLILHRVHPNVS